MTKHYLLKQHEAYSQVAAMSLGTSPEQVATVLSDEFFGEKKFVEKKGDGVEALGLQLAKHCDSKFTKFTKEGDLEANFEELKKLAEKFVAKANPEPKFSRIISTYNLKALLTGAAAYGSFVFGLTPIGLALAGVATFFASKFVASHVSAYKAVHSDFAALYGKGDDTVFKKTKAFFKNGFGNVFQFMKEVTYKAASKGMLDSTILRNRKEDGKLSGSFYGLTDLGLYNKEFTADNFDVKSLGLDAVAALGSVLALIYAPIAAPLYRLLTAVLPMASFAPLGNYALNYAKQEKAVDADAVKADDAPKAPETSLEDQLAAKKGELEELQKNADEVKALRDANTKLLNGRDVSELEGDDKATYDANASKVDELEANGKLDTQITELEASIQDLNQKLAKAKATPEAEQEEEKTEAPAPGSSK